MDKMLNTVLISTAIHLTHYMYTKLKSHSCYLPKQCVPEMFQQL